MNTSNRKKVTVMDKYAHLRPRKTRSCRRADGIDKRAMTQAVAEEAAEALTIRNRTAPVHAYQCPECGWWHTGHIPTRTQIAS